MKVIGITGGVGAGKTQILEYLNNKYGATICQADAVGKKLQKKGTECFDAIVAHFGTEILDAKGELDREKLADIVFSDKVELSVLNSIVHPAVKEEIYKKIAKEERKNTNLFILESAILIEDHYEEICDNMYRFSPFIIDASIMLTTHGTNERCPIEQLDVAVSFFKRYIKEMTDKA